MREAVCAPRHFSDFLLQSWLLSSSSNHVGASFDILYSLLYSRRPSFSANNGTAVCCVRFSLASCHMTLNTCTCTYVQLEVIGFARGQNRTDTSTSTRMSRVTVSVRSLGAAVPPSPYSKNIGRKERKREDQTSIALAKLHVR
jgi:hypothetical protein